MSTQAENFKKLVKGNVVSSIATAIKMLKSSVRNELLQEYNTSDVNILANKLQ